MCQSQLLVFEYNIIILLLVVTFLVVLRFIKIAICQHIPLHNSWLQKRHNNKKRFICLYRIMIILFFFLEC